MVKSEENSVDRRNFLKIAAGSAVALVANAPGVGAQVTGARTTEEQKSEGAKKVDVPTSERASETVADNPYTQGMAAFVSGLRYEQIPGDVIDRIKLLILDSFGCAIYGVDLEWSRILMHTLQQLKILRRLGHVTEALCTARGAGQRHPGARVRT
jgi:MmgE/PrpD N-terminal domain